MLVRAEGVLVLVPASYEVADVLLCVCTCCDSVDGLSVCTSVCFNFQHAFCVN